MTQETTNRRWKPLLGPALIFLSAALVVAPFLLHGSPCGLDFIFHFTSWHDAANSWRHGVLYPHWTSSANFGAGEPRFIFYPPLTWMAGAALGLVLPWPLVPVALNFLILAATGLATRAFARQALTDGAATLAGCTAIFSLYALYEIDFHGDFSAITGGFWIPLLLLFLLHNRYAASPLSASTFTRAFDGSTLPLALVLTGTWLSNAPLGVMACYLMAFTALVAALLARSWAPVLRAAVATIVGLGLAAFYLVPAAKEQHWIDVQKLFAQPNHLIQNRWITSEFTSRFLVPRQGIRGDIEAAMLAATFLAMLAIWLLGRFPSKNEPSARHWWICLALIPCVVLFLLFPISLPVWDLLPRLRYLEYPWRWMIVLQAPMAVFVAWAVWPARRSLRIVAAIACAIVFLGVLGASYHEFYSPCGIANPTVKSIAAMDRALAPQGNGVGGTKEYATPPGARNDLIPTGLPEACLVTDPNAILSDVSAGTVLAFYVPPAWSADLHTCETTFAASPDSRPEHLRIAATLAHAGYLVLRLRSYPAWNITINGALMTHLPSRPDGLIVVPVSPGPLHLAVDWANTPDVLLGRSLTVASLLLLLILWYLERTLRLPQSGNAEVVRPD